jgi:hypothetical protein
VDGDCPTVFGIVVLVLEIVRAFTTFKFANFASVAHTMALGVGPHQHQKNGQNAMNKMNTNGIQQHPPPMGLWSAPPKPPKKPACTALLPSARSKLVLAYREGISIRTAL